MCLIYEDEGSTKIRVLFNARAAVLMHVYATRLSCLENKVCLGACSERKRGHRIGGRAGVVMMNSGGGNGGTESRHQPSLGEAAATRLRRLQRLCSRANSDGCERIKYSYTGIAQLLLP